MAPTEPSRREMSTVVVTAWCIKPLPLFHRLHFSIYRAPGLHSALSIGPHRHATLRAQVPRRRAHGSRVVKLAHRQASELDRDSVGRDGIGVDAARPVDEVVLVVAGFEGCDVIGEGAL